MTTEQKVKMLIGATAAVVNHGNDKFLFFETITAEQAEKFIRSGNYIAGVNEDGTLWISCGGYFSYRWVFADKRLASIA